MRKQFRVGPWIISLVVISMASRPLEATILRSLKLEELTEVSDLIVLGKVMDVRSGWNDTRGGVRTQVTLNVGRVFRGSTEGETSSGTTVPPFRRAKADK
jgi:hypothetical protein